MRRSMFSLAIALLLPLSAAAQNSSFDHLVLHPNGFGEHSYCSWKAQEGLTDSTGTKNQALYFQKMTSTTTFAAGVAVIEGIEGLPVNQLTGLSFYVRDDSHCGAGAPRWNIRVRPPSGPSSTIFIGCVGMVITNSSTAPNGHLYFQHTAQLTALSLLPAGTTITALSIVFDEGDDAGSGFAFLDNVTVEINSVPQVWTSAADNGQ